jgi:hypothetical protein
MMNRETQFKLQAYVDNQLGPRESEECTAWLANDLAARALCSELIGIKQMLKGNEPQFKVPESREFYWSRIQKAIEREQAPTNSNSLIAAFVAKYRNWLRFVAPATGFAVLLVTAISVAHLAQLPSSIGYLHEIEVPIEDTSTISFHSQSAGMTVVWVKTDVH